MVYKFVSRATAEMIMLEPDAQKILKILGKDPSPTGIITVEQIPAAIKTLQAAVAADNERSKQAAPDEDAEGEDGDDVKATIGLKQRAVPFIDMLQRSVAEGADVVWGH
ncbi:MAG: DUF1840 domain-containing protein [Comamonas sp.]